MPARELWALVCLACWAGTTLAAFDETDVIQVEATASVFRDNNLYRLPDVDPRLFGISPDRKSDTVRVLGLGLKFDKTISRQRLLADLDVSNFKYDHNDNLDHTGQDLRGSWFWRAGNYWDGELGYRRRKYLAGFADSRITFKDLITSERYLASGGYQFHPRWRVGAEVYTREATHSAATRRINDFEGNGVALSLTYRTPNQNSVGIELRRNEGEYPNRIITGTSIFDDNFTENEINALVAWRLSGALRLDGAVGWTERNHDDLPSRDFSGVTGKLTANWEPTAKTRVRIIANRDIRNLEDVVSNFVLVNSLTVSPVWAVTSKIALQGDFIYETREYLGDPGNAITGAQARDDTLRTARVGVIYSPLRYMDFTVSYERGDRRSNQFLNDFDYQTWLGTIRVRF